ncbi:MAG: YkgJ family cysteine cluster protein, partial [Pseudoxanthomonas sp.]
MTHAPFPCRDRCGACCIAPSITSPIPGMPQGKPAGVPCVQLDEELRCRLFGKPERPAFCASLRPSMEMCGGDRSAALEFLTRLEAATASGAGGMLCN